jgi:hypothetical protein
VSEATPIKGTQVVYNADAGVIEFRIPLADGTGDHVLATLPATPPPAEDA